MEHHTEHHPEPPANARSIDALLEHADWVRNLARRLVRDEARAEDAVQETWIEALRHPPGHDGNPRGWLSTVLRNAARRGAQGDSRRVAREELAARPEAEPRDDAVIERARLQRELAGHVLDLREPYRTALLLRWFEGLSRAEIATRTGASSEAVRSRLRRGLELLRIELDSEYGDRSTWCAALTMLAGPLGAPPAAPITGSSAPVNTTGVGTMITIAQVSLVSLGLVAAINLFSEGPAIQESPTGQSATATPGGAEASGTAELTTARGADGQAGAAATSGRTPVEDAAPVVTPWTVRGRVLGAGGAGLSGAGLELHLSFGVDTELLGTTTADAEGVFRFDLPQLAELTELERIPALLELRSWAAGHQPTSDWFGLPDGTDAPEPVSVTLAAGVHLTGRIVDALGRPIAGVTVRVSATPEARTDSRGSGPPASGTFTLALRVARKIVSKTDADGVYHAGASATGRHLVVATHSGRGTAKLEVESDEAGEVQVPEIVIETRGVLAGLVLTPDGAPIPGLTVHASPFPKASNLERKIADAGARQAKLDLEAARAAGPPSFGFFSSAGPRQPPSVLKSGRTTTDATGAFRFEGLEEGDYGVSILNHKRSSSVATGSLDVMLTQEHPSLWVEVRDAYGRPLSGYDVRWSTDPWLSSQETTAGPAADVRIDVLPGQRVRFEVTAPGVAPAFGETVLLEGEWQARQTLVLDLAAPAGSLALTVTDPEGAVLPEVELTLRRAGALGGGRVVKLAGSDRLDTLDAGEWIASVRAQDPELLVATRAIEVESGAETELDVVLVRGALLAVDLPSLGSLKALESKIAEPARLILYASNYGAPQLIPAAGDPIDLGYLRQNEHGEFARTAPRPGIRCYMAAGEHAHPALPPGHYTLRITPFLGPEFELPVTLTAGRTTEVELVYPPTTE